MSEENTLRGGEQPAAPSLGSLDYAPPTKSVSLNASGLRALPEEEEADYGSFDMGDDISAASVMLDDLGSDEELAAKKIQSDLGVDDMDIDMAVSEAAPEIEDLSKDIKPTYDKAKSLASADKLQKTDKELLKEQLHREISSNPSGVDKEESRRLYNQLMEEKKIKAAKKGFGYTVLLMILGFVDAGLIYLISTLNPDNSYISMQYAIIVFCVSFLLMIRSKFIRNIEIMLFMINTVILIGPGLVMQAVKIEEHGLDFNKMMLLYGLAIIVSGFICFQLVTNNSVELYFTSDFSGKKKVVDESKPRRR